MKLTPWALMGSLMLPVGASAFDMRLNGFMSVAGGMTLGEDQHINIDPLNVDESDINTTGEGNYWVGYNNELDFTADSMVAIQAMADINEKMSATAQLVGRGGDGFNTTFEWAYLSYEATENLELRAGRVRMPIFYYSDFLELGYGYQWVRPPVDTYNVFVTSVEGVSGTYEFYFGDLGMELAGYLGSTQGTDPETGSFVDFKTMRGVSLEVAAGDVSLRGSYNTAPDATLTRIGVPMALDFPAEFVSGAAVYDNGTLFSIAEYTKTINDSNLINNRIGWYASAGYRIGTVTPHLTYSVQQTESNMINPLTGDPAPNAENPTDIRSITGGVRWDFNIAAALKLEYTHREDNTDDPYRGYGDADLITVAVDVVF
ncbi:hypothetical protein [Saccharospirillum salsuginis]|uniref:Porin n=1 Tax=Saccharospirillum salsuginis TaxID=418750 RepID=A0A918KJQ9_9GAMM|nr:hypothetical protein [Saccharospirillum salsuginis]GGX66066.1 hypothetical protein GCM10007392_37120 [Saccharospirillum salsuginis]